MAIPKLPYLGKSISDEKVVMENIIPAEYFGKTMAFLSADKVLKIWMDERLVYEFGVDDVRSFGHTPGSVFNFVDIPSDLTTGSIRMEMVSPYDDYAARVTAITIGERDVLILELLEDNLIHIADNLIILICGIIFFLLFLIQIASGQNSGGVQYLCGYCIVASLYYFVETKVLHVFYVREVSVTLENHAWIDLRQYFHSDGITAHEPCRFYEYGIYLTCIDCINCACSSKVISGCSEGKEGLAHYNRNDRASVYGNRRND